MYTAVTAVIATLLFQNKDQKTAHRPKRGRYADFFSIAEYTKKLRSKCAFLTHKK